MDTYDQEFRDVLGELDLSEEELRAILEDIQQAEEIMEQHDRLTVDPEIIARAEARIRPAPHRDVFRQTNPGWWRQVAAAAAAIIIMLGMAYLIMPQPPGSAPFSEDEMDRYWRQVLAMENKLDREINDTDVSEVLHCWSDVDWEVNDILDSEGGGAPKPMEVSRINLFGYRYGE